MKGCDFDYCGECYERAPPFLNAKEKAAIEAERKVEEQRLSKLEERQRFLRAHAQTEAENQALQEKLHRIVLSRRTLTMPR